MKRRGRWRYVVLFILAVFLLARGGATSFPLVLIGHRGGGGGSDSPVPEHSCANYVIGAHAGSAILEPDVQITKDGQLIVIHDIRLSSTTDVESRAEFAGRRRDLVVKDEWGRETTIASDWFPQDFTLGELKTLWMRPRGASEKQNSTCLEDKFRVQTFSEVLTLTQDLGRQLKRTLGVAPETKHPYHYRSAGLPMEESLIKELAAAGYLVKLAGGTYSTDGALKIKVNGEGGTVQGPALVLQSFEPSSLKEMRALAVDAPLMLLEGGGGGGASSAPLSPEGLAASAEWMAPTRGSRDDLFRESLHGVSVSRKTLEQTPGLRQRANAAKLRLTVYTYNDDAADVHDVFEIAGTGKADAIFANHAEATAAAMQLAAAVFKSSSTSPSLRSWTDLVLGIVLGAVVGVIVATCAGGGCRAQEGRQEPSTATATATAAVSLTRVSSTATEDSEKEMLRPAVAEQVDGSAYAPVAAL